MAFYAQDNKYVVIPPRHGRDDARIRELIAQTLKKIVKKDDLLCFDLNDYLKNQILCPRQELFVLENDFWNFLKTFFVEERDENKIKEVAKTFSLSDELVDIFRLCDDTKFEDLKDNYLLSFCIEQEFQQKLIKNFDLNACKELNKLPSANDMTVWSVIFSIATAELPDIAALRLGLSLEFINFIKSNNQVYLLKHFANYDIKFKLRCSEKIIANILVCDNQKSLEELQEIKFMQIISGTNSDLNLIKNKLDALKEMGLI